MPKHEKEDMKDKFTKFVPLYIRDYRADTGHLTLEQHGAYLLLLMEQWERGSIANDDYALRKILLGNTATKDVFQVIDDFFTENDVGFVQPRLKAEREKASEIYNRKADAARQVARKRGAEEKSPVKKITQRKEKQKNVDKMLAPTQKYEFNGSVIKLTKKDFDGFKELFPLIDLISELKRFDLAFSHENIKNWYMQLQAKLKYQNDKKVSERSEPKKLRSPRGAI